MEKDQAITVIEQALNMAAQKGVFNLRDSGVVNQALNVLLAMKTQPTENTEEVKD
jgi:hypothetical protein